MFDQERLKRFLRGPKAVLPMMLLWFILMPLCSYLLWRVFGLLESQWSWTNVDPSPSRGKTPGDVRSTLALVLGLISSLYLIGSIFGWAKTRSRPGGAHHPVVDCAHCGAEVELFSPAPPSGYRSGCLSILLVPLITSFLLFPIGHAIEWYTGSPLGEASKFLIFIWFILVLIGFGLIRKFNLAALDQISLQQNPEWRRFADDEEARDRAVTCPRCGKNPF
jgi:DNA-directed RNA polymerase subunit RPC12/RpoP